MTTEIQKQIDLMLLDRANIKYNKHDKHDNNDKHYNKHINTFNDGALTSDNQEVIGFASFEQEQSQKQSQELSKGVVITKNPWAYLKLDLFNNASIEDLKQNITKLHCNLSIKQDNNPDWIRAGAALNSDKRMAKRGLNLTDKKLADHWDKIQEVYNVFKQSGYSNVRASKFYKPGKGQKGKSIKGFAIVLGADDEQGKYSAVIIKGTDIYDIELNGNNLTQTQRKKNIIASGEWQANKSDYTDLTVDDFLGL